MQKSIQIMIVKKLHLNNYCFFFLWGSKMIFFHKKKKKILFSESLKEMNVLTNIKTFYTFLLITELTQKQVNNKKEN